MHVYAVWQPMLPTDWSAPSGSVLRRLSNERVRQYWDPNHVLATQMKKDARAPQPEQDCCVRSDILWDLAAVYPPGAVWSEQMPPAVVFNGPVVDVTDAIEEALAPNQARALPDSTAAHAADQSPAPLVFLTRDGCVNTARMRRNVDAALKSLGREPRYEVVDQDTLPRDDVRRGYPTPTLLYADHDVFGMAVPKPPLPEPT
jgi:hypothetical protein